jgi:hypothetical protein
MVTTNTIVIAIARCGRKALPGEDEVEGKCLAISVSAVHREEA